MTHLQTELAAAHEASCQEVTQLRVELAAAQEAARLEVTQLRAELAASREASQKEVNSMRVQLAGARLAYLEEARGLHNRWSKAEKRRNGAMTARTAKHKQLHPLFNAQEVSCWF